MLLLLSMLLLFVLSMLRVDAQPMKMQVQLPTSETMQATSATGPRGSRAVDSTAGSVPSLCSPHSVGSATPTVPERPSKLQRAGEATSLQRRITAPQCGRPPQAHGSLGSSRRNHAAPAKMLRRLYQFLRHLDSERRREVLVKKFGHEQRLAMEQWMLQQRQQKGLQHQRPTARAKHTRNVAGKLKGKPEHRVAAGSSAHAGKECRRRCQWRTDGIANSISKNGEPLKGIAANSHGGRKYSHFSASVLLHGSLELRTRQVNDLNVAISWRDALLGAKRQLTWEVVKAAGTPEADGKLRTGHLIHGGAPAVDPNIVEAVCEKLPEAVQYSFQCRDLDIKRAGVYMRTSMSAKAWIGTTLCGPAFHLDNCTALKAGLQGWRRMLAARGSCAGFGTDLDGTTHHKELGEAGNHLWHRLCQAHLDLWAAAGRDTAPIARRLRELEECHSMSARCRQERRTAATAAREARRERQAAQRASQAEERIADLLAAWTERGSAKSAGRCHVSRLLRPPTAVGCVGLRE